MLRPVSLNHIFQLEGGAEPVSLQFSLSDREADFVNEVGVFLVDDDLGTIGSITPGTPEYLFSALSRGNVIFSALSNGVFPNLDSRRLFSFNGNARLGFYLVSNSTTDQVLADLAAGGTSAHVFFCQCQC